MPEIGLFGSGGGASYLPHWPEETPRQEDRAAGRADTQIWIDVQRTEVDGRAPCSQKQSDYAFNRSQAFLDDMHKQVANQSLVQEFGLSTKQRQAVGTTRRNPSTGTGKVVCAIS
jgi:hypothetical protein